MRIFNRVVSDGNVKFDIEADKGEKDYELIRVAELINDFSRKHIKVLRPYAIRINSEGGENITTASEKFVETVVDVVYRITRYNFYSDNNITHPIKIKLDQSTMTVAEFGRCLKEQGINNNINDNEEMVLLHSLVDYIDMEILFDFISEGEVDCEDIFYRNKTDKNRYFPCFITSKYGMKYELVGDNLLKVDMDLYVSNCEEILNATLESIIGVFSKLVP